MSFNQFFNSIPCVEIDRFGVMIGLEYLIDELRKNESMTALEVIEELNRDGVLNHYFLRMICEQDN